MTLPWEAAFLPRDQRAGYDARELTLEEAVKSRASVGPWRLDGRPVLILVYDPARREQVALQVNLEQQPSFVAASRFFNLIRVDIKSVENRKTKKRFRKLPAFLVFDGNGSGGGTLAGDRANDVLVIMKPAIARNYRQTASKLLARMTNVLARQAAVKAAIAALDNRASCPRCGVLHDKAKERRLLFKKELKGLLAAEASLVQMPKS